ncbi:MAG: chromosome segregation protein SMC, partial [Opitutaceae bacterium]
QRTARLKLLQQLQEKWEGFGQGAKAILQGRLDEALAGSTVTPVTRGLQVDPQAGKAVEALLGSAVEAIHVTDLATARRILTQLEQQKVGSAVMQIDGISSPSAPPDDLPPFLQPASKSIINLDDEHPAAALLSACYVADDLHAFLDYWQANPNFGFVSVATRKGDLVDRRGLVSGGFNKKPENSIVQREIDLRETAKSLADDQQKHDSQKKVIDGLNHKLAEAEAALEAKRNEVLVATQEVAAFESEARGAQRVVTEGVQRIERMQRELSALEAARNEAQERFNKARAGLAEAEQESTGARERINQMEVRIVEIRTDRDVKRDTLAQARLELAERRQKVEVLDRGIADMQRRREQMAQLFGQRQQEIEVWSEQITSLEHESESQKSRAAQIGETLVVAQEQVDKIREKLTVVEGDIEAVENAQHGIRSASETAQGELGRCEVRLAETSSRAQFIAEDVMREYSEELENLNWRQLMWRSDDEPPDIKTLDLEEDEDPEEKTESESTEGEAGAEAAEAPAAPTRKRRRKAKEPKGDATEEDLAAFDSADWTEVKSEVAALRQRLNSMGAVNLVAIEEYAELKQRFDFLKGQSDDLTNAKTELLTAIDEINQTSQKQFAITFEQIQKNFKYTFDTLFGGGVARLDLIEADDILESGIEITAQPPGTKLKSITLLSGGQKTLTAVALLFALYMVKPSPFCLLDELDAPLDESNIGRFTALLKKFVSESQFIIITHNKRTVSAAEAIYGVTMEERGVSSTVSMKFNHDRGDTESHPETIAEAVRGLRDEP